MISRPRSSESLDNKVLSDPVVNLNVMLIALAEVACVCSKKGICI